MVCYNKSYVSQVQDLAQVSASTWLCLIGTPLLVFIGIFGNVASFMVFRKRALRSASHFYFCALLSTDSMTLVFSFLIEAWLREYVKEVVVMYSFAELQAKATNRSVNRDELTTDGSYKLICFPSVFMRTASQTASVYLLITFTATRTLVIVRPLQSAVWATVWNAKKCVLTVASGSVITAAGVTWYHAQNNLCDPLVANDVMDFIFLSLLPSLVLLVFNCIIMSTIYRRERTKVAVTQSSSMHVGGITKRLLTVTVTFIMLEIPFAVYKLYVHVHKLECQENGHVYKDIERILRLFSNVNYSINFLLYCVSGEQFRHAVWLTLRLVRPSLRFPVRMRRKKSRRKAPWRPSDAQQSSSLTSRTVTSREYRSVAAHRVNLVTIEEEMLHLDLQNDEIEFFNMAVENELEELKPSNANLFRSLSLPSFVHLQLESEHKLHSPRKLSLVGRHCGDGNATRSSRQRSHSLSCARQLCTVKTQCSKQNSGNSAGKKSNRRTMLV